MATDFTIKKFSQDDSTNKLAFEPRLSDAKIHGNIL